MNRILYSKSAQKTKTVLVLIIIVLLLILGFFGLGIYNKNSSKILKGVTIDSVDVANMTVEEATETIKSHQDLLQSKEYVLTYGNREVAVSGDALNLEYVDGLVEQAYEYGRNGNLLDNSIVGWKSIFNTKYVVSGEFELNENNLNEKLAVLLEEEKAIAANDTYEISGDKILITKGNDGVTANINVVKQNILANSTDDSKEDDMLSIQNGSIYNQIQSLTLPEDIR